MNREVTDDCRRWVALASLAMTLGGCASALPPPQPLLGKLAIAGITVEPTSLEEADTSDREWFEELLTSHATATARRVSIQWQLAERVEQRRESHHTHRLSGSVSIPIALPPDYRGSRAAIQQGALAVARIELRDAEGALVSTVETTVRWKDVRWTSGGPKTRRARRGCCADRCRGAGDGASGEALAAGAERATERDLVA